MFGRNESKDVDCEFRLVQDVSRRHMITTFTVLTHEGTAENILCCCMKLYECSQLGAVLKFCDKWRKFVKGNKHEGSSSKCFVSLIMLLFSC